MSFEKNKNLLFGLTVICRISMLLKFVNLSKNPNQLLLW